MKYYFSLLACLCFMVQSRAQNVGIGTTLPEANLHVNGTFKFTSGTPAAGKVLTSDATGNGSWQPAGITLPYAGSAVGSSTLFSVSNTGTAGSAGYFMTNNASNVSVALQGVNLTGNSGGAGVYGQASGDVNGVEFSGVSGQANGTGNQGAGVRGRSNSGYGVIGGTQTGIGVYGIASQGSGVAGFFSALGTATALSTYGPVALHSIGEGNGKVLTSDANGLATWQTPAVGWSLTGNGSTIPASNFIGTTDLKDLNFRMNNIKSGTIAETNTAFGYESQRLATGVQNVSIGSAALKNTTSSQNTAMGYEALKNSTSGEDNTAVGAFALEGNETGIGNVAIGRGSLLNSKHTDDLVAVGREALYTNGVNGLVDVGAGGTAIGARALFSNQTGSENTSLGYYSMEKNIAGNYNTAAGWKALALSTGSNNSAVGNDASGNTSSGTNNSSLGFRALFSNTTGSQNTGLGSFAGFNLPVDVNNVTCLGYGSGRPTALSNQVFLGNTSVTHIIAQVTGITAYSDGRIKQNVQENVAGLKFIMGLRPVTYNVNLHTENRLLNIKQGNSKGEAAADYTDKYALENVTQTGFIAQEVESAAKKAGYNFSGLSVPKNNQGLYGINYTEFVVPLVKAVQEQQEVIAQQNKKLEQQQQLLESLSRRLKALEEKQ